MPDIERSDDDFKQVPLTRVEHGQFRADHAQRTVDRTALAHCEEIDPHGLRVECRVTRDDRRMGVRGRFARHLIGKFGARCTWKHRAGRLVDRLRKCRIRAWERVRQHAAHAASIAIARGKVVARHRLHVARVA